MVNYGTASPDDFFLYKTVEEFRLAPGFHGRINSRSSWARYGSASREAHNAFTEIRPDYFDGKVVCGLNTLGTTVKIRPGDAIAQAHLAYRGFIPVDDRELEQLIKKGLLEIKRGNRTIKELVQTYMVDGNVVLGSKVDNGRRMNGGFTLTLDPLIRIYKGGIIDPHNPNPDCFEEVILEEKGLRIPKGTFFLSASAESIKIDKHYAGWVDEWNSLFVTSGYHGFEIHPDERPSSLQTHACAPKIDPYPRFNGKITFENYARGDEVIKPGQRITELYLFFLNNPYVPKDEEKSRYKGQKKAISSKAHLDYQKNQLELPLKTEEKKT